MPISERDSLVSYIGRLDAKNKALKSEISQLKDVHGSFYTLQQEKKYFNLENKLEAVRAKLTKVSSSEASLPQWLYVKRVVARKRYNDALTM